MKKDAYYFPHFCNARHDRKLKRVQKELGVEGYGIYFMLLEVLREQTDFRYPMGDVDLLADEFGTSEQKVETVICNYNLFEVDESGKFFSSKLVLYIQPYIERTEKARAAARARWDKVKNAPAMLEHSGSIPQVTPEQCQGEERKGEERKGKENKTSSVDDHDFKKFWDLYDKKVDNKKCLSKWKRLKQSDRDNIFNSLPAYIASTPDKVYRKNPLTYLNGNGWESEIIKKDKGGAKKNGFNEPGYYGESTPENDYF